ncbi:MAG: hypothetical protein ACR2OO_15225 [Thermomicrobiales bacterium]
MAIELPAAPSGHLSPQAIVNRLAAADDVLRDGPVDRPPHRRAVRDTVAWSCVLLDPDGQAVFRRLSIFAGGFLAQAAHVCGAGDDPPPIRLPESAPGRDRPILDRCMLFADKSPIFKAEDLRDEPRFSMLPTIGGFTQAELRRTGEWDAVGDRHAA